MVESGYGRDIDVLETLPEKPIYSNETLFEDLPEYTEDMKEANFMDTDIYGNEINFWSEDGSISNAELAIQLLEGEEKETPQIAADGGIMETYGQGFDRHGEPIPGVEPGTSGSGRYLPKSQEFHTQMAMNEIRQPKPDNLTENRETESRPTEYDRMIV